MEENNGGVKQSEIDLRVVLEIIRKNIIPIILVTVLFGAAFYVYSRYFVTKQYQASAMLIVNNNSSTTVVNNTEITAAQSLADLYAILIKSDTVLNPVLEDENLKEQYPMHNSMTYEKLRDSLSVSSVDSTQIISVSMKSTDMFYARDVLASLIKTAPDGIMEMVEAGTVSSFTDSKIDNNGKPVSPNSRRIAIIGALLGFVIALAIAFLRELTNNTFKTEDDIAKSLGIPLLGMIPAVDTKEFNKNV